MSRLAEIVAFASLAVGAHLGAWFMVAGDGAESAGAGGEATVSLTAATGEVAELVAAWTAPTEALQLALPDMAAPQADMSPAPAIMAVAMVAPSKHNARPTPPDQQSTDAMPVPPAPAVRPPEIRSDTIDAPIAPAVQTGDAGALPAAQPAPRHHIPDQPPAQAAIDDAPPAHPIPVALPRQLRPSPIDAPALPAPPSGGAVTLPDADNTPPARMAPKLETARLSPPQGLPALDRQTPDQPPQAEPPRHSLRPVARPAPIPPRQARAKKPRTPQKQATPAKSGRALAQKAAGNTSGQNAGRKKDTGASTLSRAARQSLMAKWGASIRNSVERHKRYPRGTRASGTTVLRLTVAAGGQLVSAQISRSSGDKALDQAALSAVRRTRFRAAPKGLSEPSYRFNLPLAFTAK